MKKKYKRLNVEMISVISEKWKDILIALWYEDIWAPGWQKGPYNTLQYVE